MEYKEFIVKNLGYTKPDISGLSNKDEESFAHAGYIYPDLSTANVLFRSEAGTPEADKTLIVGFTGTIDGGEAVEDVIENLIANHGWPVTSVLVEGIPTIPSEY